MSGGGHGGGGKRRGIPEEHEEHENHERWLVSYADMMTLLMVLFIVMFAISQVDDKKFAALKTGLSAGFGAPVAILTGGDQLLDPGGSVAPDSVNLAGSAGGKEQTPSIDPAQAVNPEAVAELVKATNKAKVEEEVRNLEEAQKQLSEALKKAGASKGATFRFDERGLVVTIATENVLFDSGSATIRPEGRKILDALAPGLRKLPNQLSIDGHTNSIPISTAEFPSNWELSSDRATGVVRYLHNARGIGWNRMSATGFADTRPLLPGTGARALSANRRVEIVVLARLDESAGQALEELAGERASAAQKAASTTAKTPTESGNGADSHSKTGTEAETHTESESESGH